MNLVRISSVNYLNSSPFIYGIERSGFLDDHTLELDIPSVCGEKLLSDKVDIGLVPIAILPKLKEYHIVTDYCIGAVGEVKSVKLFSDVILKDIEEIHLDNQSITSIELVKILAQYYWNISPMWKSADKGFESLITEKSAGVVIGDRALELENRFNYSYDLASEWKKFTDLPFVFACWISNKKLPESFINNFSKAIEYGIQNKREAIKYFLSKSDNLSDLEQHFQYLSNNISYKLDSIKLEAMDLFLGYQKKMEEKRVVQSPTIQT